MPDHPLPEIIAIDGPAASGKSTVGAALAKAYGYRVLDTGMTYRALTFIALERGVPAEEGPATELAESLEMRLEGEDNDRLLVDGRDVTGELRSPPVEAAVSDYSAIPGVRKAMVRLQREIAGQAPSVVIGRDIGTVVFPNAKLKLFLTASEDERARRRSAQAGEWGQAQDESTARADIGRRDTIDSTRATSPTRPADDAIVIDTTGLSVDEVVEKVLDVVRTHGNNPAETPKTAPRTEPQNPIATVLLYWGSTYLLRFLLWVLTRWKVIGREHIPKEGGLIVVSNHLSMADPPIVGAGITGRRIRFMAKQEVLNGRFGFIPRTYGAFPVRRFEADVGALIHSERLLKRGEVLGMFPEGTRSRTGTVGKPHPGTALIALRSGAPVLPCSLFGTEVLRNPLNLLRRPRFTMVIHPPIQFERMRRPDEAAIKAATDRIFAAIVEGLPPEYRGSYTECGSAEPHGGDRPGD